MQYSSSGEEHCVTTKKRLCSRLHSLVVQEGFVMTVLLFLCNERLQLWKAGGRGEGGDLHFLRFTSRENFFIQLTDTFGTGTQCPSQEDVCLKESQPKRSKERQGPTLGKTCLRGVHLIKVSEQRVDFTTFLLK